MKKTITYLMMLITFIAFTPQTYALSISTCPAQSSSTACTDKTASGNNPIISALKVVLNVLSFVAGIIAVITLIIAGLRMVVGGGNMDQYNSARNNILYSVIGIVVVVMSQTIVIFVLDKLK